MHLQKRGLAEQTIFNYASVLRAFLNYLEEEELLGNNPMRKVKMPRLPQRILPAFSPDDVHRRALVFFEPIDRNVIL